MDPTSTASQSTGASSVTPPAALRASAVVLAAGLSRRMGPRNKLLLPMDGEPMVRRAVGCVLGAGFVELVVVLGHAADDVARALAGLPVRSVLNADYASGQVSSVRTGLAALNEPFDAVCICLGDQPLLTSSDLRAVLDAYAARPHGSILVPFRGDRRGNPVMIDAASARETLERGTSFGCRHFIQQHPERVYRWPAPSDHYVRDVDEPADYQALIGGRVP